MKGRAGRIKPATGLLAILCCILLNLGGKMLADLLQLPMWLDMVGTCLCVYFFGFPWAIVVAVLNNILYALVDASSFWYLLTGIACVGMLEFCTRKGYFEKRSTIFFSSFWIGICSVIVSVPINLLINDGYSGNVWGDALFDMMRWYQFPLSLSAIADELIVEILDKQICVFLAAIVIKIVKKQWKKGSQAGSLLVSVLMLSLVLTGLTPVLSVKAGYDGDIAGYNSRIYNNQNGMMTSEANVIAETEDGYLWIGSYAGLTRFDGIRFELIHKGGIANVTSLFCDSKGRLWIGTNDNGIVRYENGEYSFFTTENGLPVNSIRAFCEGKNGEIYVGTADRVCVLRDNDVITVLNEELFFVKSMCIYEDYLICSANDGKIYALSDGKVVASTKKATKFGNQNLYFNCVKNTHIGLLGGAESNELYVLDVKDETIEIRSRIPLSVENVYQIEENEKGKIWIGANTGFGYLSNRRFHKWEVEGFTTAIQCIHEDYQGNIWVGSSSAGIMCMSPTPFEEVTKKWGMESNYCNAVVAYRGGYCIATDNGLFLVDQYGRKCSTEYTRMMEDTRVRSLLADDAGNLWICSYGDYGLVQVSGNGTITSYNTKAFENVTSDRVRCCTKLSDGTIAVGTADGMFFVKDGNVVNCITKGDGLVNSQILSLTEGPDGLLYAGSDGAGLYVIKDGKIVKNYTTKDGLSSNVILRVVNSEKGLLLVTSNSLCMLTDEITVLNNFPYYNNFDILQKDGMAYILSSGGIFLLELEELCSNKEDMNYTLYNASYGLKNSLTANSWNYIDEEGNLYVCCRTGVVCFQPDSISNITYQYGIANLNCDGQTVRMNGDCAEIPSTTEELIIEGSLCNYALEDVKVAFFEERDKNHAEIVSYTEMNPIRIRKPRAGKYIVHFQIYDPAGKVMLEEKVYTLTKAPQLWETKVFHWYLFFMSLEIFCYIIWTFVLMIEDTRKKKSLAEFNANLEKQVKEQTDVIREQRQQRELLLSQTVAALAGAVDAKDQYTSGHSQRVADYAKMIAARMGKSIEEQEDIYRAGLLHDVGKIRVPEEVINKPGRLTDEEFALIKLHPITGFHILKEIEGERIFAEAARFHHERYDGKGYPNGLSGKHIPEVARIIGVADSYDAMTSNRSYRATLPQESVRNEIIKGRGTQFDPEIADIMLQIMDEDTEYNFREKNPMHKKLLIVDDEPINIILVQAALKDGDLYQMKGVSSGREAIEVLQKESYDVVLLDVMMPDMDGYATLEGIKEITDIPVVFMTADQSTLDMDVLTKAGVVDYVTKPFRPVELKEILHAILDI